MKRLLRLTSLLVVFAMASHLRAQNTYTDTLYTYRVDSNIYYGTAINYAGNPIDLYLDLYKPVGDDNPNRPVIILAFGGAWITGNRRSSDVMPLIPWFARRGYVVASIDYRLGMHTSPAGGSNSATCNAIDGQTNCAYVADTSEYIRACYRSMQDMKGAVRFLKARSLSDSTCKENFYVSGVSAGGFTALAAAFTDEESEKPASADSLPDAPSGAASLHYCHESFNPPGFSLSLSRPDLGSIEGTIALNGENSRVKGVANLFGGMIWNFMANEQSGISPLLYLYHKTSDLIVYCGWGRLLSPLSWNCIRPFEFLGCKQIWHTPMAWGSCAMKSLIDEEHYPIEYFNALENTGGFNCFQNPPGHSYQNPKKIVNDISIFFSPRIMETEQSSCGLVTHAGSVEQDVSIRVFPNPASNTLFLQSELSPDEIFISDLSGRKCLSAPVHSNRVDINSLKPGIYLVHFRGRQVFGVKRFIKTAY